MKKIAITVFGDRVSSRLDCAENILLVSVDEYGVLKRELVHLIQERTSDKIAALERLGVEVLICGGLSDLCSSRLSGSGIQVIPWVRGGISEVLDQYFSNNLH